MVLTLHGGKKDRGEVGSGKRGKQKEREKKNLHRGRKNPDDRDVFFGGKNEEEGRG